MGLEQSVSTGDCITVVLASAAILLGATELMGVLITLPEFPLPVYGAIGLLYIVLAAVMIVKIYAQNTMDKNTTARVTTFQLPYQFCDEIKKLMQESICSHASRHIVYNAELKGAAKLQMFWFFLADS